MLPPFELLTWMNRGRRELNFHRHERARRTRLRQSGIGAAAPFAPPRAVSASLLIRMLTRESALDKLSPIRL